MKKVIKACPICQKQSTQIHRIKSTKFGQQFIYFKCPNCDHIFIDKILSSDLLFKNYTYDDIVQDEGGNSHKFIDLVLKSKLYLWLFSTKRFLIKARSLFLDNSKRLSGRVSYLDYGSGNGANVALYANIFPEDSSSGYEESKNGGQLNSSGSKIFTNISQLDNNKYEIVSLFHVLEHIQNLDVFMESIKKITKSDSIILIQIPQSLSYDIQFVKRLKSEFVFHCPYHLNFFSPKSAQIFFERNGFKIEKIDYEVYQVNSMIQHLNSYIKLLLFPLMFAIAFVAKIFKKSTYITIYLRKSSAQF